MPHQMLKKPMLWPLALLLAGVPLPWVNRHCDVPSQELASHIAGYHDGDRPVALACWHFPLLSITAPSEDGVNLPSSPPASHIPAERFTAADLEFNELYRVTFLGQHAVQVMEQPCDTDLATRMGPGNSGRPHPITSHHITRIAPAVVQLADLSLQPLSDCVLLQFHASSVINIELSIVSTGEVFRRLS